MIPIKRRKYYDYEFYRWIKLQREIYLKGVDIPLKQPNKK